MKGEHFERLEPRQLLAATPPTNVRNIDGSGNNLSHPTWGSTNQPLLRLAPSQYADGIAAPGGADRPGARDVSNNLFQHHIAEDIFNNRGLSAFAYAWGQFVDHDMDLTTDAVPRQSLPIPVPAGDFSFDPMFTGTMTIPFARSESVSGTGVTSPLEQPNDITAFIDGSQVYGSDPVRAAALRTFLGGQLKTSEGNNLPYNTAGLPNDTAPGADPTTYFLAGDRRANENVELTSIHVLMMREHNRLAAQIQANHPKWTDEQIYQQARRLVIGEIQRITYDEFLPTLMGDGAIKKYTGYKPGVNPGISNEFSSAAFRFGHSLLSNDVQFFDNFGNTTFDDQKLPDTTNNPAMLKAAGADSLLKYLAAVNSEEIDLKMVDSIRNILFGPPGAGGIDLPAVDVQRGRDHGLADYNSVRASLGLAKVTDFSQITSAPLLQHTLQFLYGSVDNIDLFVGGLAEDHLPGSSLGPTFQRILADQFTRTRDGDRFWYQRDLTATDLYYVQHTTLSDLIRRNTTIWNLQPNAFYFDVSINGRVWDDTNGNGKFDKGEKPTANQWVYLYDDEDVGIDNVQTDANGFYTFSTVQVGVYHVTTDLPAGFHFTTAPPATIYVTRGQKFFGVNFGETADTTIATTTPTLNRLSFGTSIDSADGNDLKDLLALL